MQREHDTTVTPPPNAPDIARYRRATTQAYLAQASLGFAVAALGSIVVLAARDLNINEARLGWLASAFGAGQIAVASGARRLLRSGSQRPLRAGAAVMAAGVTLLAVAPSVALVVLGAFLMGLGAAVLVLLTPLLLAGPEATQRLSRATAASSAAGVIAPAALGGLDLTGVTGRTALLVVVVPLVALARSARGPAADNVAPRSRSGGVPAGVARRWTAIVLGVAVEFCFVVWAVDRLTETGVGDGTAAALASAFPIGLAVGRLALPTLMRHGWPPIAGGAMATAAGTVVLVSGQSPATATAALVLAGLGVAPFYPVLVGKLLAVPHLPAWRAVSLSTIASGTAVLVAPAVLGILGDEWGLRRSFLVTIPVLAVLVWIARPHRGHPRRERVPVSE